jgi:hypothetical protein
LGTEEDGVDEAGSKTQSSYMTAPDLRESDPEVDGNAVMTSSGSARSGSTGASGPGGASRTQPSPRAGASGTTDKDDARSEDATDSVSEESAPPTPSDGIRPSFTPVAATSASSASSSAPSSTATSSPAPSAYSPPAYSPPDYSRSAWSRGPGTATATQNAPPEPGFSSAATAAAAGLAGSVSGSVSGFWQRRAERKASRRGSRGPTVRRSNKRQAMLTLSRVEPWSVMKFSFVASVVAFIILFVAVAVLYMVLSSLGVFDSLQNQVNSITASKNASGTNISHWFSASLILGYTALLGALNIVLITALSTIGSVIYNLIAKTVGGIEVTLRETD